VNKRPPRTVQGSHRVWLLGDAGPLDEPKGHFRNKEEALRFARKRPCWVVWEPALDGPVKWTYKEPKT
jgi:hypothetical protein